MKRVAHISDGYIVNVSLKGEDAVLGADQMLEADALAAGYSHLPAPPSIKNWPDTGRFLEEFTPEELAAISLSTDTTVAYLRMFLSGWRSEVHSDDPRVVQGLITLVGLALITEERKAQILA
jgi:hypothetical protein